MLSSRRTSVGSASGAAGAGVTLSLLVELAPGLTPPAGSTLFVFAREVGGLPMPLAVSRLAPD
ncbi:MAG: c-type cytochrome biogenesis protein CcmI, partial [Pseudomonadales bacterium]|nr:c-type cytochrome biogenesis protein CcmI [Pseudomonadales bacterium]